MARLLITGFFVLLALPMMKTCCNKINLKAHGEKLFIIQLIISNNKNKLKRNNTFIV